MRVLLSIKPEFVEKIFQGTKRYEFRKALFRKAGVSHVLIYASSPVKRVVGEFQIEGTLSEEVDSLWAVTKEGAGISKEYFLSYFKDKAIAHAILLGGVVKYKHSKSLSDYKVDRAPQSFCYVRDEAP